MNKRAPIQFMYSLTTEKKDILVFVLTQFKSKLGKGWGHKMKLSAQNIILIHVLHGWEAKNKENQIHGRGGGIDMRGNSWSNYYNVKQSLNMEGCFKTNNAIDRQLEY